MRHKIVAQRLIFSNCPKLESSKRKKCRVFMENMNEGSMQFLCLLISPQGWGTLRLYCFTATDGLHRDVHCASPGYVCMWAAWQNKPELSANTILVNVSGHESVVWHSLPWRPSQTTGLINAEKCGHVCERVYVSMVAYFWGFIRHWAMNSLAVDPHCPDIFGGMLKKNTGRTCNEQWICFFKLMLLTEFCFAKLTTMLV